MNKRILTVAVAALALAACSKNETVEVAGNRAIEFGTFVNKATRAVTDVTTGNLTKFYVFGYYGTNTVVFDNIEATESSDVWVTATKAYWEENQTYNFAAYSNGNAKIDDVTYAEKVLTIPTYTVAGNDLIVAYPGEVATTDDVTAMDPVELTFKHILSKVKFTFSSEFSDNYTMTITGLKFNAPKTGKYVSNDVPTWTVNENDEYGFTIAAFTTTGASDECYVLPQSNQNLEVTFTVEVSDGVTKYGPANLKATLATGGDNTWKEGYAYNYTALITADDVEDGLSEKEIKFSVKEVEAWDYDLNGNDTEDDDITVTPSSQVQP